MAKSSKEERVRPLHFLVGQNPGRGIHSKTPRNKVIAFLKAENIKPLIRFQRWMMREELTLGNNDSPSSRKGKLKEQFRVSICRVYFIENVVSFPLADNGLFPSSYLKKKTWQRMARELDVGKSDESSRF